MSLAKSGCNPFFTHGSLPSLGIARRFRTAPTYATLLIHTNQSYDSQPPPAYKPGRRYAVRVISQPLVLCCKSQPRGMVIKLTIPRGAGAGGFTNKFGEGKGRCAGIDGRCACILDRYIIDINIESFKCPPLRPYSTSLLMVPRPPIFAITRRGFPGRWRDSRESEVYSHSPKPTFR